MKISKSSWHYRFNNSLNGSKNVSNSICGYFWQIVGGVIGITLSVFMLGLCAYLLLTPALTSVVPEKYVPPSDVTKYIMYFDIFLLCVAGLCVSYNKSSFLRLCGAYLKAIKNKMCPLIEFEDKNDTPSAAS